MVRPRPTLAWLVTVVVAAGAGWWAAEATLEPPRVDAPAARPATYTVVEGTVGRSLTFTATASWPTVPLAANAAAGTVTSVDVDPGRAVDVADRLYSVDERPVVAAEGTVPTYRELASGARGDDVEQLQILLTELGHYRSEPTGRFTVGTATAVRAWQRSLGMPVDGVVRRGDVVFVPHLPARVVLAGGIVVGKVVSPGEEALALLPDAPRFVVALAQEQRDLVPLSAAVIVEHPDGAWEGQIASAETGVNGDLELVLEGVDGAPICGAECAQAVPPDREVHFRARIVAVPETTGPVVPAAALQTSSAGEVTVTTSTGTQVPVTLVAADAGQAVVDGLEPGATILLFGPTDDAQGQTAEPTAEPSGDGG